MFSAVVFAYSEVGLRCLEALLAARVDVRLVLTHENAPGERTWFGSVAQLAAEHGVPSAAPADPNSEAWIARVRALAPDYLLSFYYRLLLGERLLACARWGALNMHGSLLPKYRGRAPVNWAIVNGETETGATLHYMVAKPDAGAIIAQQRVPIGIDATALGVSRAVAEAASALLSGVLPQLAAGPPPGRAMDLSRGSYFGRRTPEDGRIDWARPAARIHDLIRAVAPPFPGAFSEADGRRVVFTGSRWLGEPARHPERAPCLYSERGALFLDCADGMRIGIDGILIAGRAPDADALARLCGPPGLAFDPHPRKGILKNEKAADTRS